MHVIKLEAWSNNYEPSNCDPHGLSSKPTSSILLCLWKKHFRYFPVPDSVDKQSLILVVCLKNKKNKIKILFG